MDLEQLKSVPPYADIYREVFNLSPQGIIELDSGGKIITANLKAVEILDALLPELMGRNLWDILDVEETAVPLADDVTLDLPRKNREENSPEKWIRLNNRRVSRERSLIFFSDVTDLKRNESIQALIYEILPIAYWECDVENRTVTWDEPNYSLYSIPPESSEDPIALWAQLLSPEELKRFENAFYECAAMPGRSLSLEVEVYLSSGQRKFISIRATSEKKRVGEGILVRGISFDITVLEEARRKLSLALDTLELGIWDYQPWKNKVVWSPRQYHIFGLSPSEFDGTFDGFCELLVGEDKELLPLSMKASIEQGQDFNTRFRINHPEKGEREIRARSYTERDREGRIVRMVGLNWDITDEVQREIELEKQRLLSLEQARFASMGIMAAGIAHEINNPLTIIMGYSEKIMHELLASKEPSDSLINSVEKIQSTSDRIHKIIKSLKALSRDRSQDPFETHSLSEILQDSLAFAAERLEKNTILTNLNVASDLRIRCRPVEISQVFVNLLNNSIDAIKGSSEPWISIEALKQQDGFIKICFTDSGKGIPEEVAQHIMNPFYTTKPSLEGTGLGLSISEKIVKAHRGSIKLDKDHKLTRFIIQLPPAD